MKALGKIHSHGLEDAVWHCRDARGAIFISHSPEHGLEADQRYLSPCGCKFQTIGEVDGFDNVKPVISGASICKEHEVWLHCNYPDLTPYRRSNHESMLDGAHKTLIKFVGTLYSNGEVSFFTEYVPPVSLSGALRKLESARADLIHLDLSALNLGQAEILDDAIERLATSAKELFQVRDELGE